VNHNGIKTIVTLYRRKTPNRRRTWMVMHVRDSVKSFPTPVTSHGSISIQKSPIDITRIVAPHMYYEFVHGIEIFST
jgi:hypothetical protein